MSPLFGQHVENLKHMLNHEKRIPGQLRPFKYIVIVLHMSYQRAFTRTVFEFLFYVCKSDHELDEGLFRRKRVKCDLVLVG